jgi:pimeloyl-ACP methyl ester carboxylesterase
VQKETRVGLQIILTAILLAAPVSTSENGPVHGQQPARAPAPPPYRVEPLTVTNGTVTLDGTLTIPGESPGPVPAVVLLTGSGAQNRDEDVFGFKVFAVLADHLTRHGIAVYRHDDRGVGKSTGTMATATTEDFAGDALAAVERLRKIPGIDPKRIGLVGHSEGGVAAAMAAARSADVAFIAMLAGTAVPIDQALRQQARDFALANGATPAQVERILAAHRAATDAVLTGAPGEELERTVRALVNAQVDAAPAAQVAALGDRAAYVDRAVKSGLAQMTSPWMKFMLRFDPATALKQVRVPVFAAFGEIDTQVPPSLHLAPLKAALAGNPRLTVTVYPGANHLFQRARTGLVTEYATLERAFIPGLPDDLAKWILAASR